MQAPVRPFPAAAFAAAYAGDMHDAANRASGRGSAVGIAGIGHVLIPPGADRAIGPGAAEAGHPALASIAGRYGEAAALGSPPPYDLVVTAGGNRTAAVRVGPHALSSPVEFVFAAGPSPGGIVAEPVSPSPGLARVRAAEWFGPISGIYVDGEPHAAGGRGGPPCRPYCEVPVAAGGATDIAAVNAWGGAASLSVERGRGGGGELPAAADLAYGPAVAYAEASVPYLVAACIAAACLAAYGRLASAPAAAAAAAPAQAGRR